MRGFLIFLGLLLILSGGAVAGAQYVNLDLSVLDTVAGAEAFLLSPMALYAGGGAAAFGLLLIIIAAAIGGKKAIPAKVAVRPARAKPAAKVEPLTADNLFDPEPAPSPAPEIPRTVVRPAERPPQQSAMTPTSDARPSSPAAKPTASSQPPEGYEASVSSHSDPRLLNRKRVKELVSINDALRAYHDKHGAYPKAEGLLGFAERGEAWIPGLAPDFIPRLPNDPAAISGQPGPQYVYASDGKNYKLLAQNVSLIGGTNVEVLGVRIDPTRRPTAENAAFGFWTPEFASA